MFDGKLTFINLQWIGLHQGENRQEQKKNSISSEKKNMKHQKTYGFL